jgi:hypothetical protein
MRRRTSVESAASLRPHDHSVWFGDGQTDLYAMASDAFAEGVRRGEKLIFVATEPDASRLLGIDVERRLEDRQLEVADVRDVYGGTDFSAGAQLATFQHVLADALADGYSGIRVVADNTSLAQGDEASFERWLAWEQLTDHFQAESMVTGICFFDRGALSSQRMSDLAALHPMWPQANAAAPPFALFADRDSVLLVGSIGAGASAQLRRLLATVEFGLKPSLDLSAVHPLDDSALLVLGELASAERPLTLVGNDHLRRRLASLGPLAAHLSVRRPHGPAFRCSRCGDVIGVYETAAILTSRETRRTSTLAEPEAVADAVARFHSECLVEA